MKVTFIALLAFSLCVPLVGCGKKDKTIKCHFCLEEVKQFAQKCPHCLEHPYGQNGEELRVKAMKAWVVEKERKAFESLSYEEKNKLREERMREAREKVNAEYMREQAEQERAKAEYMKRKQAEEEKAAAEAKAVAEAKAKAAAEANAAMDQLYGKRIVEVIREFLDKPTGEFTKADLEKVTRLNLEGRKLFEAPKGRKNLTQLKDLSLFDNQLTDVTGLENLTQLKQLILVGNPDLTKAQIDELEKALPKCAIISNPTK